VISSLRTRLYETGCLGAIALALAAFGALALLLELQSPSAVLWTGRQVVGRDTGGVVLYPLNGHTFTIVVSNESPNAPAHDISVFVDPNNPAGAYVDNPLTRWLDATFVATPFIVAAAFLALALTRTRRRTNARRIAGHSPGLGPGFDLDELRARRSRRQADEEPPDRPA
jgi:hypothetical protein